MLINAQPDMEVVGEAADGIEAVLAIQKANPDVAILDVTMPRSGGLDAIKEIVARSRSVRVLLLTMHEEPAYLRTALAAGATGYVRKKSVDANLLSAIRAVHPQGSHQKRPTVVTSKPANGGGLGQGCFTPSPAE